MRMGTQGVLRSKRQTEPMRRATELQAMIESKHLFLQALKLLFDHRLPIALCIDFVHFVRVLLSFVVQGQLACLFICQSLFELSLALEFGFITLHLPPLLFFLLPLCQIC